VSSARPASGHFFAPPRTTARPGPPAGRHSRGPGPPRARPVHFDPLHDWPYTVGEALALRRRPAGRSDGSVPLGPFHLAAGCAAARFPYVPGLLSAREVPPVLRAISCLRAAPAAFMLDGRGVAHPRRGGRGPGTGPPGARKADRRFRRGRRRGTRLHSDSRATPIGAVVGSAAGAGLSRNRGNPGDSPTANRVVARARSASRGTRGTGGGPARWAVRGGDFSVPHRTPPTITVRRMGRPGPVNR
jgi:hypothetical protein